MNLKFLRSEGGIHTEGYYESFTEVVVFGDSQGYLKLYKTLLNAAAKISGIPVKIESHPNEMDLLIMPKVISENRMPVLKLFERPVFFHKKPKMELVIVGNSGGLRKLALTFKSLSNVSADKTVACVKMNHHSCKYLKAPSVALNIRRSVIRWDKKALGPFSQLVYGSNDLSFPSQLSYLTPDDFRYTIPDMSLPWLDLF